MKPLKITGIIVFLLIFNVTGAQEKYSKVKVFFPAGDIAKRNELVGLLEIDHFIPQNGFFVSEVNATLLERLDLLSIKYEVLVDDIARRLEERNRNYYARLAAPDTSSANRAAFEQPHSAIQRIIRTPADFDVKPTFGGYYSFAEMNAAMNTLVATFPTIAQKISIGTTAGLNNIWCIKISDNVATDEANEPEILYMGLQHAREAITGASMIFFMQYLCENYATDSRLRDLINNREIFIIPCFNPDGWEYNRTSATGTLNRPGGGWRKNRRNTGGGTGVDLNRNWGIDWADCDTPIQGNPTSCGSASKGAETYWGTAAFSEAETQAVRTFVKSHHFTMGFDQHAYGPYYSLPFGRQSLHPGEMSSKGLNFFTAIPALMGTYNGMRAGDSYDALHYEVAGGFKDWMLMGELGSSIGPGFKDTVWAMTGEGAAGGGSSDPDILNDGFGDFWPDAGQIINLCKGMCYQDIQLAFAAGTYVDIQDASDMVLTSTSGQVGFNIKRLGLGNGAVTISLIPLENMQSAGAPVVINSMSYYEGKTANINYTLPPTLSNGQRVKYAWKVEMGGYSYSDTIIKFLNPVVLLQDDMEGSFTGNWQNTATNMASGFGYNYTVGNWLFTAGGMGGAGNALSESAANTNYGSSSIRTCQYKNELDISDATAAYLSFWTTYHAENFRDKMQVQVSTNGTSWTALPGSTTVQEPGLLDDATINGQPALTGIRDYWTREVYDLSPYKGAAHLRLRFVFTSDNDPSTFAFERADGFYIDNLNVIKSTSTLSVLPVRFISFTGQLLQDESIRLDWAAVTDQDHDRFEVEKSMDGVVFTLIGEGPSLAPYRFIDHSPFNGNNYYRIRQVDKDGKLTFSNTINVAYNPYNLKIVTYPNPVKDILTIRLSVAVPGLYTITITDIAGRKIAEQVYSVGPGGKEVKVDLANTAPQLLFLTIRNAENEVVATQKLAHQR